jgi:Uma2 family endonuclease
MAAATNTVRPETLADLLKELGNISPRRVRLNPLPGKATEKDLLKLQRRTNRLYELVDGVLVEKIMGYPESSLACDLIILLGMFLAKHDLGNLAGMDGTLRLMPKLVRIPDLSFVRWEKLPNRQRPAEPIPDLVPNLAVEVLSEGNTPGEMRRKLREYFLVGVEVVWFVDPRKRTVTVYTAPDARTVLAEDQILEGGKVLPGLNLPVKQIFERVPRTSGKPRKGKSTPTRRKPKKAGGS